MATLSWYCPVGDCLVRDRPRPGTCPVHITPLVRQEPEPAPEPPGPPAHTTALACPWGTVDLPADELLLGREAPVFRGGPIAGYDQISRRHARLYWRDGELRVEDLGSTNGTFVDGRRVQPGEPAALEPGAELRLGLDVSLRVVRLNEFGEPV